MADAIHLTIRVIHVLGGVFWAGATFMVVLFLEPVVLESGPAGGVVMGGMARRGYTRFIGIIATLTVLTGLWLMWTLSGHFSAGFMGSRSGILLSVGMVCGILALGVGLHGVRPTVSALVTLGGHIAASGAPPTPEDQAEMDQLQGKMRVYTRLAAVLLLIALVTMALGPHI